MPTETKSKIWFTTYFKRPNLFRFAFVSQMMENRAFPECVNVIWSDGRSTHFKSPTWPFERQDSLRMAIAAATGISYGSAFRIPRLLMPDLMAVRKDDFKETQYVSAEPIENEVCDRIHDPSGLRKTDCWISQSRSIIVRTQERDIIGPNLSATFNKNRD
jgi:hypothetical protein